MRTLKEVEQDADSLRDFDRAESAKVRAAIHRLEQSTEHFMVLTGIGLLCGSIAVAAIAMQFVPWDLIAKVIAVVDSIALVAGAVWLGEAEKRVKADLAVIRNQCGY